MSHYIRWQGMLGFVIICALFSALFYFFAEPLAKAAIENGTSEQTGAEVNIEKVEIALSPFAVTILSMQVTDPKQPTHNMISFEKAKASISLWPYLFGKTIIDDLDITSLKFNEKRAQAGQVYVAPSSESSESDPLDDNWMESMQESLPDPKTILANANLKTVKRAQAFEQSYNEESEKLAELKTQLPNKEKLKEFEAKVKALTKVKIKSLEDLQRVKAEFYQLKEEFKIEQAKVKTAKKTLLKSKTVLSEQLLALKNAPAEDWQDIEKKYQLEQLDAQDFAHLIFGEKARQYYQVAEIVFDTVKPLLNKSAKDSTTIDEHTSTKGRFVHFEDNTALPSFWLKKGNISIELPQGTYQLVLNDITHQHWLISKKSMLSITADNNQANGSVQLDSTFEVDSAAKITADGIWKLAQVPLKDIRFKETEKLNITLASGMLGSNGRFDIANGELSLDSMVALAKNDFVGKANSKLGKVIVDTLQNLEQLTVDVDASGNVFDPTWAISSPLDNMFSEAFKQQVSAKFTKYKSELQSGLNDKLKTALDLGESQEAELLSVEALFSDADNALENLKNNDVVKQKQKELEDKAKDKLKEKLGDLFG